jgi:hypothetical protein
MASSSSPCEQSPFMERGLQLLLQRAALESALEVKMARVLQRCM